MLITIRGSCSGNIHHPDSYRGLIIIDHYNLVHPPQRHRFTYYITRWIPGFDRVRR